MSIAHTTYGPVQGRERDSVLLFAGIPYAAPPTGELRFRPPQPPAPWTEVRPANRFGPAAPQIPTGGLTASTPVRWDEDCLTLNVTTPALDDKARPVLFWIHGGAYRTGQGAIPWYNGGPFARNGDIVVVSINYRLGALGFTDLSRFGPEYESSGANGILDQICALQWVRDNIRQFGGDPARITIAGESAGAYAVCTLMGSPRAQGLFRAAIPQSGGAHHTLPPAAGNKVADLFLQELGASDMTQVLAASAESVLQAQARVIARVESSFDNPDSLGVPVSAFYPTVGNSVLPRSPLDAIRGGMACNIPVLTGTNRHETTLWGYGDVDDTKLERVANLYNAAAPLAAYRAQRPDATAADLMIALTTDHVFRIPAVRLAEARAAQGATTWMYWFCWESRAFGGRLGATHALEIPFAFNNLDKPGVGVFLGEGPKPQVVADAMHAAWIRFVREGEPGWRPYDTQERATMRFDDVSELVLDPDGAERASWAGIR